MPPEGSRRRLSRGAAPPRLPLSGGAPGSEMDAPSLRQIIAAHVEATSLRHVAAAVGLSPNGVRNYLQGASPRSSTVKRLAAFAERKSLHGSDLHDDGCRAAIELLARQVPPALRQQTRQQLREVLARAIRRERQDVLLPAWLADADEVR